MLKKEASKISSFTEVWHAGVPTGLPDEIIADIKNAYERAYIRLAKSVGTYIQQNFPEVSGEMKRSSGLFRRGGALEWVLEVLPYYAKYVEKGTGPRIRSVKKRGKTGTGKKLVVPHKIRVAAQKYGIDPEKLYWSIMRKGTKPHPFWEKFKQFFRAEQQRILKEELANKSYRITTGRQTTLPSYGIEPP